MYDIIGDVHGNDEKLVALLQKLGYHQKENTFFHHSRKIIFLGDLIDKGTHSREVLFLVSQMVEKGYAYALPGNHEWFLISYFTQNNQGEYLRAHTEEHYQQLAPTLANFADDFSALIDYIHWIKTLPLFLSIDGIRAVHAYWHTPSVAFLQRRYGSSCTIGDLLPAIMASDVPTPNALNELIEGLTLPEPSGDGTFKVKWWQLAESDRYQDLAIRPDAQFENNAVDITIDVEEYTYPPEAPLLFFGHYNLPGQPVSIGSNFCCLDYSVPDQAIIPAYRWEGESIIDPNHIVY